MRALERLVRREVFPALDPHDTSTAGAKVLGGEVERVDAIFGNALVLLGALRAAFARANAPALDFLVAMASTIDGRVTPLLGAGVLPVSNRLAIDGWVAENVRLIRSIDEQYLDEVAAIIELAQREGFTAREAGKLLRARTGVARSRAKLIARDQIATVNGQITRQRQTEAGVREFIWRTSQDERVRESHAALEGQRFRWDAPPPEGIPGQPINCRCTAEPVLDEVAPTR